MYVYDDTLIRHEREQKGQDHCASKGQVFDLATLVNGNGEAIDPTRPGILLDNSGGPKIIYAVSTALEVHIAFDGARGAADAVKHETLFHNANVAAAGEVSFVMGRVSAINDHSGTYGTYGQLSSDPEFASAVRLGFSRTNVLMDEPVWETIRFKRR